MEVFPKAFQCLFLLLCTSGQGTRDKAPPPCSKKSFFHSSLLPSTKHLLFAPSRLLGLQATRIPGTRTFSIVDQQTLDLGFSDVTAERWVSRLPETLAAVCGLISA